jgi:hypothetical protein
MSVGRILQWTESWLDLQLLAEGFYYPNPWHGGP